jgi:hypothetical protein
MQEFKAIIQTVLVLALVASPFALILVGAIHRAKQRKNIGDAAEKYLKS